MGRKRKVYLGLLEDFIPRKGDKPSQLIYKGITFIFYIAFIISIIYVYNYFIDSWLAQETQIQVRQTRTLATSLVDMTLPQNKYTSELEQVEFNTAPTKPVKELILTESAKSLLSINKDTVGYIKIPNTGVDSVVVQGTDNTHYLEYDVNGNKRQCGTIFVDSRALIGTQNDSPNLLIYGHNQKDGTMFGDMDFYRWDLAYWKTNPIIYFDTNYESNAYLIVASFVTNVNPEHDNGNVFDYWNYIYFNEEYNFDTWKKEVLERTRFFTGYDFTAEDEYITLSTCSTEWEPSRHVLIARKLHTDESVDAIDTSKWVENSNPKFPQIWYDYNGGGRWIPES